MEAAHNSPNVLVLAKDPEHLARLEEANKLLEEIQKARCHECLLDQQQPMHCLLDGLAAPT